MAQHISIERIDENGKLLQRSNIEFAGYINLLHSVKNYENKYPLLAYIDPYGDTYLNILQRPIFIEELKQFNNDNRRDNIQELLAFIKNTGIHEYIRV